MKKCPITFYRCHCMYIQTTITVSKNILRLKDPQKSLSQWSFLNEWPIEGSNLQLGPYRHHALNNWANLFTSPQKKGLWMHHNTVATKKRLQNWGYVDESLQVWNYCFYTDYSIWNVATHKTCISKDRMKNGLRKLRVLLCSLKMIAHLK